MISWKRCDTLMLRLLVLVYCVCTSIFVSTLSSVIRMKKLDFRSFTFVLHLYGSESLYQIYESLLVESNLISIDL